LVEQFKMHGKLIIEYSLKKIKFGKDYEFFPQILQSKKNWEEDRFEDFIEENKVIILSLQSSILKSEKATQDIFINMLGEALQRQEFAIIASKYYPIVDLIINALLTIDNDKLSRAISLMKELHHNYAKLDSKISKKLTKMIEKRIKMAEKAYNEMLE
jgi:hypothetical protein